MMSSRNQDEGRPLGTAPRHHKSSERLHRAHAGGHGHVLGGGGGSSTALSSKRSKSYSQIMNAAHTGGGSSSKKKKQQQHGRRVSRDDGSRAQTGAKGEKENSEDNAEDEGWTSSSHKGTPNETETEDRSSRSENRDASSSDEEEEHDEGIVVATSRAKRRPEAPQAPAHQTDLEASTHTSAAPKLERSDTSTTIRGDERTPQQGAKPLPEQGEAQDRGQAVDKAAQMTTDCLLKWPSQENGEAREQPQEAHQPNKLGSLRPELYRSVSSASARTLAGTSPMPSNGPPSPKSIRSVRSMRNTPAFLSRGTHKPAAPPKVSAQYVFAGDHSPVLDRSDIVASPSEAPRQIGQSSFESASHYRIGSAGESRRKPSLSSSRSSFINLASASPSAALLSNEAVNGEPSSSHTSRAIDAMQRASSSGFASRAEQPRQRTRSWQSGNEAVKLASKLRMSHAGTSDGAKRGAAEGNGSMSEATRMLASSGSKYFTGTRASGADGPTAKALAQYHKPTVSTFVKREDDFKATEQPVPYGSLYDKHFARASAQEKGKSRHGKGRAAAEARRNVRQNSHGGGGGDDNDDDDDYEADEDEPPAIRYVMDYGLSGPAVQNTLTTQALLSTCLDHDEFESSWAPALAQAAGLGADDGRDGGPRRLMGGPDAYDGGLASGSAGLDPLHLGGNVGPTGGFFINGPNATPLHFLHGLTNTNDSPFPLDATDIAGPGALAALDEAAQQQGSGDYLDAKSLRAVAQTWAALNAAKTHIMTRRYVDPMRESMERVAAAGGIKMTSQSSSAAAGAKGSVMGGAASGGSSSDKQTGLHTPQPSYFNSLTRSHTHGNLGVAGGAGHNTTMTTTTTLSPGDSVRNWGWRNLFSEPGTS